LDKSELQDELCLIELVDESLSLFKVSSDWVEICETSESFLGGVVTLWHPGASFLLSLQQLHWPVVLDPYAPQ
jgi:hypothetical protein